MFTIFRFAFISISVLYLINSSQIDAASVPLHSLYISQKLQPKDGYVPVYIRFGDTPLFAINPDLASAFQEIDIQQNKIKSNKMHFKDVENGNIESNGSKEGRVNAIINSIDDLNSRKTEKMNKL